MTGAACSALLIVGCGGSTEEAKPASSASPEASAPNSTVMSRPIAPEYDPTKVSGLPVTNGASGIKADAPKPTGEVRDTDGGEIDSLALLAVNDTTEFWEANYPETLQGAFDPVGSMQSYDSNDPSSPRICGDETYNAPNAAYCFPPTDLMYWDRGQFFAVGQKFFGDISIAATIGHEYGHELQVKGKSVDLETTEGLVYEQQADCFAGVYMRFVAEGKSKRFEMSTGDGLNHVLAGLLTIRDELVTERDTELLVHGHGTALDRISAFQMGFEGDANVCTAIDFAEIEERRGDLPLVLTESDDGAGNMPVDSSLLDTMMELLNEIFSPENPPTLKTELGECDGTKTTAPVSYCPADNTILVDLPALQEMGEPATEYEDMKLLQGDNTAISMFTSRYALAIQHEKNLPLDDPVAALQTACLTGVAQAAMVETIELPSGNSLVLTAGDVDEAVSALISNGLVASDVNGETVPAGFTRIVAYRSGLAGDEDLCYERFS